MDSILKYEAKRAKDCSRAEGGHRKRENEVNECGGNYPASPAEKWKVIQLSKYDINIT